MLPIGLDGLHDRPHRLAVFPAQIGLLVLRVDRQRVKRRVLGVEEIDHPHTARLAPALGGEPHLADAAQLLHHVARLGIGGQIIHQRLALLGAQQLLNPPGEDRGFNDGDALASHMGMVRHCRNAVKKWGCAGLCKNGKSGKSGKVGKSGNNGKMNCTNSFD